MVRSYVLFIKEQLNNTELDKELLTFRLKKCEDFCINKLDTLLPAGNYMFKINNRNTRKRYETCSKLTIKTPKRCQTTSYKAWKSTSRLLIDVLKALKPRRVSTEYTTFWAAKSRNFFKQHLSNLGWLAPSFATS